jgi:alkylation response protein AidB-like acyl-CoA dehydrogenase
VEYGGRGLPPEYEAILLEEMGSVGLPSAWHYGYIARVILLYGNEEQKRRFLPPAFSGEERWCQGFSEPGAGSDLGALTTRAHLDGDSYVVNGQKVWTTEAKWADWCFLLARTDPEAPTHRAMSCFIVPIDAPGLTVRPFRQITGAMEFAELFFDDVRVPVSARVGEAGEGWRIAMSTVSFERGPGDVGYIADLRRTIGRLTDVVRAGDPGGGTEASPAPAGNRERALRLAQSIVDVEVLRVHVLRSLSRRTAGLATEVDASVDKLLMVRTEQALGHAELDLHGAGVLTGEEPEALHDYLWSRAASVYGGSEQIQRTIVATRLLGLPRGP